MIHRSSVALLFAAVTAAACGGAQRTTTESGEGDEGCPDGQIRHYGSAGEAEAWEAGSSVSYCARPGDSFDPVGDNEPTEVGAKVRAIRLGPDDIACDSPSDCPASAPLCQAPELAGVCGPQPPSLDCPAGFASAGCSGACIPTCTETAPCAGELSCDGGLCLSPRRCYAQSLGPVE